MKLYDNSQREKTIAPNCPWYEAQQKYDAPNVNWCEPTICAYINEPANTWSNLGFILVGILIWQRLKNSYLKTFGAVVVVMGTFSAIYHATNNFATQLLDFLGMSLMMSYLLAFHWRRLLRGRGPSFWMNFGGFLFLNLVVIFTLDKVNVPVQMLLFINALPLVVLDLYCGIRDKMLKQYGAFAIGLVTLILAQVSAQIDLKRIYCEPDNVFLHGHVIWHLLCAVAMYFIALHMIRTRDAHTP
ncbi:MAG: ceramidase domain-containing protein [Bdellovibrionaceae bacterium]|nr:ceramidase domain-containing protein [Pseudobdellovibrionaceae bacterium]